MSGAVAICCIQPAAFVRAQCWAVRQGLTSVLPARADWPRLQAIQARTGDFSVITDGDAKAFRGLPTLRIDALTTDDDGDPERFNPSPWPDPVSLLFTSGSTGQPAIVRKREAAIRDEIQRLRPLLPPEFPDAEIMTTVPLEHMYGYLFACWLPWLTGARLYAHQVVLPQALQSACRSAPVPVWLVTTPVHLRAYCEAGASYPNVAGIFCATAPLSAALAEKVRTLFGVPVTEIYGSTETGAIASRQWSEPGQVPLWRALDGIRLRLGGDAAAQTLCDVTGIGDSIVLADQITLHDGGFHLTGRVTDLVKVAGKRHSLAALNELLTAIPGVADGLFFNPPSEVRGPGSIVRLAAMVVPAPGWSHEQIRQQVLDGLREQIDPVFLPRPLYVVEALPRLSTGKLRQEDLVRLWTALRGGKVSNEIA